MVDKVLTQETRSELDALSQKVSYINYSYFPIIQSPQGRAVLTNIPEMRGNL